MGRKTQRKGPEQNFPRDSPGDGGTMGVTTMTNGDKIRSMTDEELAKWMCSVMTVECCDCTCPGRDVCTKHNGLDKWMKREMKNNDSVLTKSEVGLPV